MRIAQGFTIIEWLIYFFLISFVLTGIFHFAFTIHQNVVQTEGRSTLLLSLSIAHDVVARDLAVAPGSLERWKNFQGDFISWKQDEREIFLGKEKESLVRTERKFNRKLNKWGKKTKSLLARHITSVKFHPKYQERASDNKLLLHGIRLLLKGEIKDFQIKVERTTFLKTGEIL